jgi:D-alanyl-D-alanine carboxypeptidase
MKSTRSVIRHVFIFFYLIAGGFVSITSNAGSGRGDFHTQYRGKSVDDLIIAYMEQNNIPGMSLAIVQAPYITRVVGYGLANVETKQLIGVNSIFPVGQLTNAYTAVAVMQLKEDNKLKLDDPLSTFLTDLPTTWQTITIRQLLTHSSGIPCYKDEKSFDASKSYNKSELLGSVQDKPLLFVPGTEMHGSATDNYLLGLIIEKASGMTYQDYVQKNQIERLGLKHTFFIANENTINNETGNGTSPFKHSKFLQNMDYINPTELATGYRDVDGALQLSPAIDWSGSFAGSGIVASAEDISFWDIGLAGEILVKDPADRAFLYHPVALKSREVPGNVGWLFPGHPGLMEIKGNVPGFSAFLSRFTAPTELLCVTLLANKEGLTDLDVLARKIAAAFDEKLASPYGASWSETIESPYSVELTLERVSALIKKQGGKVFAKVDHSGAAKDAGLQLPPTQVLIIGNPAKGTALMQDNSAFALDLPLRIMATKDEKGRVWLSYTDPVKLAKEYEVSPEQKGLLKQMSNGLSKLTHTAISPEQIL